MNTLLQSKKTILIVLVVIFALGLTTVLVFTSLFNSGTEKTPTTIADCDKQINEYNLSLKKMDSLCLRGDTLYCKRKMYEEKYIKGLIHKLDSIKNTLDN